MSVADPEDTRALLGGARRVRTRVRGFAPWAPRGTTLELLEQVRGVLGEYCFGRPQNGGTAPMTDPLL